MALHQLRRHQIPMAAHFRHSLVVSYAFPVDVLQRLLPPGLTVDAYGDVGFAAVAVVQTEGMRPAALPRAIGRPYLLVGYRIFCRFRTPAGRNLRGLYILRSDADAWSMVLAGNALTRYGYHHAAAASMLESGDRLEVGVQSDDGEGDLRIVAHLAGATHLPPGSPFESAAHARRFAGPMPFTFDHEPETNSIVVIEGVRKEWQPRPVRVEVDQAAFFRTGRFGGARPVLANAFHVAGVDYKWRRGVVHRLEAAA